MTPHADTALMFVALAAYAISALALLAYFFTRNDALRAFGAPLAAIGCVAQFAQLVVRFETTGVWPLLNLYGSLSLFAAMGVLIFIILAIRYDLWFAGGFVVGIAALFLAYGTTWNEGTMPAVPSLQSYWIKIHIPLVVSSYAAFLVAFVISGIYLAKTYVKRTEATSAWLDALPSLPQVRRPCSRSLRSPSGSLSRRARLWSRPSDQPSPSPSDCRLRSSPSLL